MSDAPVTEADLVAGLAALGVQAGDTLLVHSSLSSLGHVVGGAQTVVQALLTTVGPTGTIVVPTFTTTNTDPQRWARTCKQPVPEEWWDTIRAHQPPFDPAVTASNGVGVIAETVRTWPGAVRSAHPQTSFAALGADAADLMAGHAEDCHLGEDSPLGRLAALSGRRPGRPSARILLLGVPYTTCTAFHLAEYRQPDPPRHVYSCVVRREGRRFWWDYDDVLLDDGDFGELGVALEEDPVARALVQRGGLGRAQVRVVPFDTAVEFARRWMAEHRERSSV